MKNIYTHLVGPLTVVQAVIEGGCSLAFITSTKAMSLGLIEVSEVNQSGSVNNLKVKNLADVPVFFSDGDILKGAKQNRVLNTSVLLAPKTETVIPVSCIEAGRWRHVSANFCSSNHVASSALRAVKARAVEVNYKASLTPDYQSDQHAVWGKIASDHAKLGEVTGTSSMAEVYEKKQPELDAFLVNLRPLEGATAVCIFFEGKVLSLDIFARPEILSEYLPKLVRGALVDSYGKADAKEDDGTLEAKALTLFQLAQQEGSEGKPSVSLGIETRFSTKEVTGFRLTHEGLVHASLLQLDDSFKRNSPIPALLNSLDLADEPRLYDGGFRVDGFYGNNQGGNQGWTRRLGG